MSAPHRPSAPQGSAPLPHFDSVLRAAPAYDDLDDNDDDTGEGQNPKQEDVLFAPSEPVPQTDLATAARPYLVQHASLHAFLDAHSHLEEQLDAARDQIHVDAGKLTSRKTEANRYERVYMETVSKQRSKTSAVKRMVWTPKRRRAWKAHYDKTIADRNSSNQLVERLSQALEQDKRQVTELEVELTQYKCVEGRLDLIDDAIFGGLPKTNDEEKDMHRQFHVLHEIVRRLDASVQLETRAQKHLDKALSLCTMLIKELLKGLNIGIKIGVPTNTKHKTQLWSGTSPTHSARTSRGLVLRAKTICGDLHTNYIQARAVQRRVGILPPLEVIAPNRLPGMKTKNVVDELGLHRSLEQSYAEAKIAKTHIEAERRKSKERQRLLKIHMNEILADARKVWLNLRAVRRAIMGDVRAVSDVPPADGLPIDLPSAIDAEDQAAGNFRGPQPPPPYRRHLASGSTVGVDNATANPVDQSLSRVMSAPTSTARQGGAERRVAGLFEQARANEEKVEARQRRRYLALPAALRASIDSESNVRARELVRDVSIRVGGVVDDDNVDQHALADLDEEDVPGFHLAFG